MTGLLRFRDLREYGVNNWPTLGRWIKEEGFPTGFYLAANTRAWDKDECDTWLANRPKADPPPENAKPRPCVSPQEAGRTAEITKHPLDSKSSPACQALPNGRAGAHG